MIQTHYQGHVMPEKIRAAKVTKVHCLRNHMWSEEGKGIIAYLAGCVAIIHWLNLDDLLVWKGHCRLKSIDGALSIAYMQSLGGREECSSEIDHSIFLYQTQGSISDVSNNYYFKITGNTVGKDLKPRSGDPLISTINIIGARYTNSLPQYQGIILYVQIHLF